MYTCQDRFRSSENKQDKYQKQKCYTFASYEKP